MKGRCLVLGLFVCFLQGTPTCSSEEGTTYNSNYPVSSFNELIIECQRKYLLSEIQIVGVKTILDGLNLKPIHVYGKTTSLLVNIEKCAWKQRSCPFESPKQPMVTFVTLENSTKDDDVIIKDGVTSGSAIRSPVHEMLPEFLRPVLGKCIKSKLVSMFYTEKEDEVVRTEKFNKRRGVIKSHHQFPWFYDRYRDLSDKYKFTLKKKLFMIEIKFVHICEGDSFMIRTAKREDDISDLHEGTQLIYTKKEDKFVELEFTIAADSDGCQGFLLCYKATKNSKVKKGQQQSVCDTLYDKNKTAGIKLED